MDYLLKKQTLDIAEDILDTVTQQPVDLDFTLPDYCPDIEKILKCTLLPKIYSRNLSAGQLRVDGASLVRILYCDGNKKALRCCEQTVPFSATFPVSGDAGESVILLKAKPEYLNCRALTPRRLSVHGAFSLYAAVKAKSTRNISQSADNEALQIKVNNEKFSELCEFLQEQFSVSESVSVTARSTVEAIVRSEIYVDLKDISHKGDKLALSAEATLKMLYISDAATGEVDQFVYVFPISQLLDSKSADCDVTDVRLDVLSYELMLSSRIVSEEPMVNLELKMCATVLGYKYKEVSYICDAYSVCDDVSVLTEDTLALCNVCTVNKSSVLKASVAMGDRKIQKIVDIFCEEPSVTASVSERKLTLTGKLNVCVLAVCDDGEYTCIERRVDVDMEEPTDDIYSLIKNLSFAVSSVSYRIGDDNELALRFDTKLRAVLGNDSSFTQVTEVEKTGEKPHTDSCPLTLYYAQSGEKVWDIAKHYCAPVKPLCAENSLEEDVISQSGMLFVFHA